MGQSDLVLPSGEGLPEFHYLLRRWGTIRATASLPPGRRGVPGVPAVALSITAFYLEVSWPHGDGLRTLLWGTELFTFPWRESGESTLEVVSSSLPARLPPSDVSPPPSPTGLAAFSSSDVGHEAGSHCVSVRFPRRSNTLHVRTQSIKMCVGF